MAHLKQAPIRLSVNGRIHEVGASPDTALLYVLRNDLELNSPKYGCGLGECGTCSVLIDGRLARACVLTLGDVAGRAVMTLEGLGAKRHQEPQSRRLALAPAVGSEGCWRLTSPVTMSLFDQGISGAMMTSIAVSPSMAKMTATASVESD